MCTTVSHECIIGEIIAYDDTRLVTITALKKHIGYRIEIAELMNGMKAQVVGAGGGERCRVYTLADYCDGRRSTNLIRFNYCPCCGQKIDWKAIKEGTNGTTN